MPSLNHGQRVVLVVGLGAALGAVGLWVTSLAVGGWTAYAPLSRAVFVPPGTLSGWVTLLVWLALTAVWVGASVWLLRSRPPEDVG